MAARINEFFNVAHRKLTSSTIRDILQIGKIMEDFKLPNPTQGWYGRSIWCCFNW